MLEQWLSVHELIFLSVFENVQVGVLLCSPVESFCLAQFQKNVDEVVWIVGLD